MRFELRDNDVALQPGPYYASLREGCPVAHVDDFDGFWILSRYQDVLDAARNPAVFSSADGITIPKLPIPPQICLEQDDPEHAKYRRPMGMWLSPGRMAKLEDQVRGLVVRLLDGFADRGEADVVAELAEPTPAIVMAMLMGLPETSWPTFRDQLSRVVGAAAGEDAEASAAASQEMVADLATNLYARRAEPTDDMLTDIATLEIDGRPLTDEEAISMSFLLLGAGHETTVGAIGGLLYYLAADPTLQDQLRADPDLVPRAVEETLRLVAPLPGMGRTTLVDTTVDGVDIPVGDRVMLMYGSANRDPAVFADPEAFRLDRVNNQHVAFGNGVHRCVGAPLARLELKVVCEEVLKRLGRFTLAPGDAVEARYETSRGYRRVELVWDKT